MTSKNLRTIIFHLLLEQPHSGYSIAKEAEARTGWKPSWGSIYPLLESMQAEGVVVVEEKGRSKEYSLTPEGEAVAKEHVSHTKEIVGEIIERLQILQEFCDDDLSVSISVLKQMQETGETPFSPLREESTKMSQELYRILQAGMLQEHQERINNILKDARQELEKIR